MGGYTGLRNVVYFSNWSVYSRKRFAIDIPHDIVTHICYAFIVIDTESGKLRFTDEWCDLDLPMQSPIDPSRQVTGSLAQLYEMKQLNRNLKVVISIGGWGTDFMFKAIVENETKLMNFVNSCGEFVLKYNFDGIDIDWEFPTNAKENDSLVNLLKLVRIKLNSIDPNLSLSIAAPAGDQNIRVLNLAQIDQYLTFWNLMLYDFCGNEWSNKTAYHSNLYGDNGDNNLNVDAVVRRYLSSGIDSRKLVVGMPLYGRNFFGAESNGIGKTFTRHPASHYPVETDTVDYCKLPIGTASFDIAKVSASCYHEATKTFISYDNVDSTIIKAKYITQYNLGGGMWWDSAGDPTDPNLSLIRRFANEVGAINLERSVNRLYRRGG